MRVGSTNMFLLGVDENEKDEDDDDDDETDSEDWSSSEEESDEERFDDSVCPPGCDPTIFDKAVQMREQRLDIEESLAGKSLVIEIVWIYFI